MQATQLMPNGDLAMLREAYRHGDALIVDTRAPILEPTVLDPTDLRKPSAGWPLHPLHPGASGATHGGRSIDAQKLLKEYKLKTRSLTTTDGSEQLNSYIVAQCAHRVLELGELFVVNFGAQQVQHRAGLASAVELLQAIEFLEEDEDLPQLAEQLPLLSSMAIELYAESATLIAPTVFEGVLSYDDFNTLVAKTLADLSVDANNPPVHVAVVESWPSTAELQGMYHTLALHEHCPCTVSTTHFCQQLCFTSRASRPECQVSTTSSQRGAWTRATHASSRAGTTMTMQCRRGQGRMRTSHSLARIWTRMIFERSLSECEASVYALFHLCGKRGRTGGEGAGWDGGWVCMVPSIRCRDSDLGFGYT